LEKVPTVESTHIKGVISTS